MRKQTGRQFFANPGPTNIPDSVLRAMNQPSIDFNDETFLAVYDECVEGLKRVLRTSQDVFLYTASGHGAWEATLVNLLSPDDLVLIPESGYFSEAWSAMSKRTWAPGAERAGGLAARRRSARAGCGAGSRPRACGPRRVHRP